MRTFTAAGEPIGHLAYSPDGRLLAVCGRGRAVRRPWGRCEFRPARELVWFDWLTGAVRDRFRLRDAVYGPRGVVTLTEGEEDDRSPAEPALEVSFSFEASRVATAWEWTNEEEGVCVFDFGRQEPLALLTLHKTLVERIALAPDGSRLATAILLPDGTRRLGVQIVRTPSPPPPSVSVPDDLPARWAWLDHLDFEPAPVYWTSPFGDLAALAFDGRFLAAAAAQEPRIVLWDSHSPAPGQGRPADDQVIGTRFLPLCLAFAPRGTWLAVGGDGLLAHNAQTGKEVELTHDGQPVNAVAFSADGRTLLAGCRDGALELFDLPTARHKAAFDFALGPVTAVAVANDGHTAAAGSHAGRVVVWDLPA